MKNIVFFTGAGISKESGLPVFRGEGGIWETLDVDAVASARSWYCGRKKDCKQKRQIMLDFFNPIRRKILELNYNESHKIIAELENEFNVTVITQNGDDFHTRAGSTKVLYLHGEALKNASSANPYIPLPVDVNNPDIQIGDKAPDGSQIRPFVIFFDENIDKQIWQKAVKATKEADIFVVVGSSLVVYPAADLIKRIKPECIVYIIDPSDVQLNDKVHSFIHIKDVASQGLKKLKEQLTILNG